MRRLLLEEIIRPKRMIESSQNKGSIRKQDGCLTTHHLQAINCLSNLILLFRNRREIKMNSVVLKIYLTVLLYFVVPYILGYNNYF